MVGVGAARARTEAQLIEQMIDNRMDGLILVASQIAGGTLEHYARQIPIVVVGHHEPAAQGYDTINNDDQMGARLAVEAFIAHGHRDIAYLTQSDREDNYADVAPTAGAGVPGRDDRRGTCGPHPRPRSFDNTAPRAMTRSKRSSHPPTALVR